MDRREFIKKAAAGTGSLTALGMYEMFSPERAQAVASSGGMGVEEALAILEKGKEKKVAPEIRPEIRNNPRGVYLI